MAKSLRTRQPRTSPTPQLVELQDLTGGLDLRRTPSQLDPTRAVRLTNWSIGEPGALTVRSGYTQYSDTNLGSSRVQGARRIYLSTGTFWLAAWGGEVYRPTDGGVWGAATLSTIHSTTSVHFPYDRDLVATFDGSTNAIFKSIDGSSWTRFGIAPSTAASTLSTVSGGSLLANEYEVGFTYRDADLGHESNGGETSTITLSDTGALRVEVHGSTDVQVDDVRVYARNLTAGETVRRLISTAANQTDGSTLSVTITSSNWSANAPEPTDRAVPPPLKFGVVWKNRWWAAHAETGNRLHFTQIFQPQSWPATFFIDLPFEQGDDIQALLAFGDTLLVFGYSNIFLVIGQTSLDFEVRPALGAQDGAVGPRAVTLIENGAVHVATSGVYIFDGATDRLLSFDLDPGWRDLMENATADDLAKIPVVYDSLRKEVRVAVPRKFPTTDPGEFILDLNRTRTNQIPAWVDTDRTIGGYALWDGAEAALGDRGRLFSWTDTSGLLFEEATGTSANSSNLTATYEGPTLSLGLHLARVVEKRGEYQPNDGTWTMETLVDNVSQGARTIAIGSGLAVYGTATYGSATYAGSGRRMYHKMLPMAEGRTIQEKASYQGQATFRWYTHSYEIVPEPRVRSFSE